MEEEFERSHPMHSEHPKHPDNHPLRAHHEHHHLLHQITGFFLLFVFFIATLVGLLSDAPFGNVLLGFAPSIILALSVLGIASQDHLDIRYLVLALLATLVIAAIFFIQVIPGADVAAIISLNLIFGGLLILLLRQSYAHYESDMGGEVAEVAADTRDLGSLFADIEERAKQLNTAIGRVYSVYKGATAGMREKIKVQSALYGELDVEKKPTSLHDIVDQIHSRLQLLEQKESEVFTEAEYRNLNREKNISVLQALAKSEGDGILQAHAAAVSYANKALDQLRD